MARNHSGGLPIVIPYSGRSHSSQIPGALLLACLSAVALIDIWMPADPENPGARFWPQMLRLGIVVALSIYAGVRMDQLQRVNIVRVQLVWLSVIFAGLLFAAQFDLAHFLYVGYYVLWMSVFWGVYCMVKSRRLSTSQIATTGTILNVIFSVYTLMFLSSGVWVGKAGAAVATKDRITDLGYILLWFILMQLVAPLNLVRGVIAVTSMIVVVLTLERGALISLLLGLLVYATIQAYLVPGQRKRILMWSFSGLSAVCLTIWISADRISARWLELANPKTAGSGRLSFWILVTDNWMSSDLGAKIFGHGPLSTQDLLRPGFPFAHNDFLEQLHCFGVMGALLFTTLCCAMLWEGYRMVRNRSCAASVFCAGVAIYIATSLYCIVSYSTSTVWFAVVAGTMLASAKSRVPMPVRRTSRSRVPIYAGARPAASLTG